MYQKLCYNNVNDKKDKVRRRKSFNQKAQERKLRKSEFRSVVEPDKTKYKRPAKGSLFDLIVDE